MLPVFPQFKKLELTDREDIEKMTGQFPPYSDFNFVSLWSWNVGEGFKVSQLNGNIVFRFFDYDNGQPFYTFIGCNDTTDTVAILLASAKEVGLIPELRLLPFEVINQETLKKLYNIVEDRDNFDYIFSLENLSLLLGSLFQDLRHDINKFIKRYSNIETRILDFSEEKTCLEAEALMSKWLQNVEKNEKKREETKNEAESFKRHVAYLSQFPLVSLGIYVDGQLVAFGSNEVLSDGFAIAHYRKADVSHSGVYQYLERETAKILLAKGCTLLNYEQDCGILPLRQAKEAYRPVKFLKKFILN